MSEKGHDTQERKAPLSSLSSIIRMARRYPGRLVMAALSLLAASAATLAIPAGFKLIIDRGFAANGDGGDISRWFTYLLLIIIFMAMASASRFYFVSWIGERVVADIRMAVQQNLLRQPPAYFEENRPSEIAARMTTDTAIIDQVVGSTISVTLRNLLTGIGGVIYLFFLAPKLTGFLLLGIPIIVSPFILLGRKIQNLSRLSQDRLADIGTLTNEAMGAMRIVQSFGQEEREAARFRDSVSVSFATALRRISMRAVMTAIGIFLVFGSITLLMWQGAVDVAAGRMSGGSIAAFVLTGGLVAGAFGALSESWGDLLRGAGAASRLNELMHVEPVIKDGAAALPIPLSEEDSGVRIEFDHVRFHYPSRTDTAALHDFNLLIEPGERVALVGPSGAGKSTILQLILRFYDPDSGAIRLNGTDIKQTTLSQMRGLMALVPQETVIFAASARDNLRYGRWDADDAAIWDAARAAHAEEFLQDLPQGLDTFLGEGGARLSGGQRQRIAIARAILRDAPVLLLDEATSALDTQSEYWVQQALDRLMHGRTTIVIAHRLSTVQSADRIIVMDQGRIVQQGRHEELLRVEGLYSRLATIQDGRSDNMMIDA